MKILTVVCPEFDNNIHCYAKPIKFNIKSAVEDAIDNLELDIDPNEVKDIIYELKEGNNYWFNEELCFEIINIK